MYRYAAYGMEIASELACPDLCEATAETPDVEIVWGKVPECLDEVAVRGVLFQVNETEFLLNFHRVGRFWVRSGRQVIIERNRDASDDLVRVFLLTAGIGALLHQRGVLVLHGSAIATEKGAVLFVGPSGVGKSTLAGAFQNRGYALLADDICAIPADHNGCSLSPAYPQISLWADSAEKLALHPDQLTRVRPQIQKYMVKPAHFSTRSIPVSTIYLLNRKAEDTVSLSPIRGFRKMGHLVQHIYRMRYLKGMPGWRDHLARLQPLAQQVRLIEVNRPERHFHLDALADKIEQDFQHG